MSETDAPVTQAPPRPAKTRRAQTISSRVRAAVKGVLAAGLPVAGAKVARDGDITVLVHNAEMSLSEVTPYDLWKASNGSR